MQHATEITFICSLSSWDGMTLHCEINKPQAEYSVRRRQVRLIDHAVLLIDQQVSFNRPDTQAVGAWADTVLYLYISSRQQRDMLSVCCTPQELLGICSNAPPSSSELAASAGTTLL